MPDEHLKIWLGFWSKILVGGAGAVLIAIVPQCINSQFQQTELEVSKNEKEARLALDKSEKDAAIREKRLNLEQDYVTTFLERATEENVENRFRFTRYLSTLTLDPELKAGWSVLFADAERERAEAKKRLTELEGQTTEEALAEVKMLKNELQTSRNSDVNVHIISTELSMIQENAPCPENTEMVITAVKTPFQKSGYGSWEQPTVKQMYLPNTLGHTMYFSIARWCRTQDNKAAGPAVLIGPNGAVIGEAPLTDWGPSGMFIQELK